METEIEKTRRLQRNNNQRKYSKKRRENDPEWYTRYYRTKRQTRTLAQIKSRAKRQNIPFSLTVDDIQIPDICPILHIPLDRNNDGVKDNSPSVDKIIPELGYVPGNIQIISNKANKMKSNATFAEMILLGKWAEKQIQ